MKKLIPFIVLILLGGCNSHTHKVGENKQMQTIHQFISYLKNNDLYSAWALLPFKDTSGAADNRIYYLFEIEQMDSARIALQQGDIDESMWMSDKGKGADSVFYIVGTFKKNAKSPYSKSKFHFAFRIVNSDTLFDLFLYVPPDEKIPEITKKNTPRQTIHQFIGYLKKNDFKDAKAMLSVQDTSTDRHKKYISYEMIQMDRARMALQQDDITADSLWSSDIITIHDVPYLSVVGTATKDVGRSHFKSVFQFIFHFHNSDTLSDFFDYNPSKGDK